MILKSPSTTKIKKPILVGEAPFSGFYSGFYFVPLYALQHMYYGVSPRSRYSSYNLLLRKNKGVSARPRLFVKHKKDFLPLPNFYISKVFFLKRFGSWLGGKKNFFWFKPNTFFYDFFLGFFLFVIWQLGGGFRLSPLYDPTKQLNLFGFYDLKITPLSVIFKFYAKLAFFFGFDSTAGLYDYYFFNKHSLTRGFIVPYLVHERKNWGKKLDPLCYFVLPILTLIPELVFSLFFHFFLRFFLHHFYSFMGGLIFNYENKITLFDHFWIQLYAYYIEDVCSLLRITGLGVKYRLRLRHISTISTFYYFHSKLFSKYWRRKFYRVFSEYGTNEFIFSSKFSTKLYRTREYEKIAGFKDIIFLNDLRPVNPINPNRMPDAGPFFKSYFSKFYIFRVVGFSIIKKLRQIPALSELSPFFEKNFLKRFQFFTYQEAIAVNSAYTSKYFDLKAQAFRRYKFTSTWFKSHFADHWPFRFFYFMGFEYSFFEFFISLFRSLSFLFGYLWLFIGTLPLVTHLVYFYNRRVKIYRLYLSSSTYKTSNFIFRFFGYFFYTWFGSLGFTLYINFFTFLLSSFKQFIFFTYRIAKKIFLYFYAWYTYIFWLFFRPVLTIFFFIYLEFRFFFLFLVELVRYYKTTSLTFYYYAIKDAYFTNFRKFFIGSKFFRLFTREIGEDLEETPYNNDQDLEDDYISDYLSDFPAYEDFQSISDRPDQGYFDSHFADHYYDYWYPVSSTNYDFYPAKPNLEFFAENYFEQENDLFFQLFCIWTSPTLFDFKDYSSTIPPYFKKDTYDMTSINPRSWYPLELTQDNNYEEDQVEYHTDAGPDEMEVSESTASHIIPFDSDRARLSKFAKFYQKKLTRWHSYQIKNNFSRIPDSLKYLPIPKPSMPVSVEHWKQATQSVSKFFFTNSQSRKLGLKFDTIQELEVVWSRIAYEVDRNPRKFYDFLSDSKESKIFDSFVFHAKSPQRFTFSKFFKPRVTETANFIRYLHDYFSGYAGVIEIKNNKHFYSRNVYHNLFVTSYLNFLAASDHKNFINKFVILSQFSHFTEIQRAFELFVKHKNPDVSFYKPADIKLTFLEEIYAAQASLKLSQNYSPVFAADYWRDEDGITFWAFPNRLRRTFTRTLNFLAFGAPFTPTLANLFFFQKKIKKRKKKKQKKKINKNDLLKVFAVWCRHERDLLFWKFSTRGNRDHYYSVPYIKPDAPRTISYEKLFSTFLLDSYISVKNSISKLSTSYKSFMFRNYKPDGLFFQYIDGEDYSNRIREKLFQKTFLKRRAYFTYDQVIQGSVWPTLNPMLEEFFYEVYYLNYNIFSPTAFNDYCYSDFFPDDYRDSGLDIYDDYIFVGGVQDFYRGFAEGSEDLIVSPDEYGDEDTDTLEIADESNWRSDEYMDYDSSADEGLSYGDETGGENPVHYLERFWFNSDWFFFSEHVDSDEGFEEWEPDEFDSMYDLDHSIDRLFFGALKRKNHFPATDQRIFLGTLYDQTSNLDKDLDYSKNFEIAVNNAESKSIAIGHIKFSDQKKNYFNFYKLYLLAGFRFFLYFIFAIRAGLVVFFFSNFDNPKYYKLLKARAHYLQWYDKYTSFYNYKQRLDDWIKFFGEFKDEKVFFNYVALNKKNLISEPHTSNFIDDPYGRFWFQFPFTNHLRDFSYYTSVNLLETDFHFGDIGFNPKLGKFNLNSEEELDKYQTDTTMAGPGADLSGIEQLSESNIYKTPNRFFSSDLTIDINFFRIRYRQKLDNITSFPWFSDRAKIETVGSDFTYLDLMFVDDIPEDDEFIDEEAEHHPFYTYNTSFFYKYFERGRYGASRSQYLPNDGTLDGLSLEEVDWDIGSMVSFSSDDFNTHLEDFSEKYDLYSSAFSDWFDIFYDYFFYTTQIKFKKFVLSPFRYWETSSNSNWLKLAADYGVWVLIIRNFFNLSIFIALLIYGFFTITRLSYYFFGEFFSYGFFGFFIFILFFIYSIFILRFLFKSANDFYKSFDLEERIAVFVSLTIFFYVFNLNGYMRNSAHYAVTFSGSSSTKLMLSNNFSADWRRIAVDWYPESGFQHRPEINYQGWLIYKIAPLRPRYYYEDQTHKQFAKIVNPDRQVFGYSFNLAPYPTYFNPYNIYNFMKFQLFNVTNENFVGYTQYDRAIEANNVRTSVDNAYTVLHRPQIVNWLHMTTAESREMAKKEIAIQGALSVSSPALFSYSAVTVERKKYNNREFVNPVNQSKVWTPYSPVSTPRSLHPYDFRPKQILESYNINANKLNSSVYSNYLATRFNKNLSSIDDIPDIVRRDVHIYKNQIDAEGDFLGTAKTRKYIRSSYKLFNKKNFLKTNNLYERSISLRWYHKKLAQNSFLYRYSDNFRKYLFLYNPQKAKPLRDAYMLSFKDLVPYPEFLGHGKTKIAKITKSDYFRFLDSKQKKLYFAILEAETFESAGTLIQQVSLYPKSGTTYKFYFNAIDSSRFPLDYFFFEEYIKIYESIIKDINSTVPAGAPRTLPYSFDFYYKMKFPITIDNFYLQLRDFISNSRLESIDSLTNFFSDYMSFKNLRYKNYYDLKISQIKNVHYETKLVQANRMRRSKLLSNYFRVVKAANKQALSDYYRNAFTLINPYKQTAFFNYASSASFGKGINKKKNNFKIYDPFYSLRSKNFQYRSSFDNRFKVYNSEADYLRPVFDLEKRLNRRLRKRRFINKYAKRYTFGWHEYWYVEATFWYIFLDFIMVRDILENADSVHGTTFEDTFDYKFNEYNFNSEARKFFDLSSKNSIINMNTATEKKISKKTFVDNYLQEQRKLKNSFIHKRWETEYDDDQFMEPLPRYTYADRIGGVDLPPLRTNRFNFRKPHFFTRIRSEHWSAIAREPSPFERQRKPFFGVSTRDEAAFYFEKKFKGTETDEFPFHMVNHILRSYIWFNTLQRSRMLYKKSGRAKTYPYNQKFLKLFTKTSNNISDYIDDFASPLDIKEWQQYKDQFFVKLPIKFLSYKKPINDLPAIFNKKVLWQNNPDFNYNRVSPKISTLEKNVVLRARLKFFKRFLQDKKKYKNFHKRSYKFSRYFKELQSRSGFDTRGQKKILKQKDRERYREYFFHGIIRSDEEKGEADIILLRAKKRKQAVKKKVNRLNNEKN